MSMLGAHVGQLDRERVRVLMVSYKASLRRKLLDDITLAFSFRMTIGSVDLISSIYAGANMDFTTDYISSAF